MHFVRLLHRILALLLLLASADALHSQEGLSAAFARLNRILIPANSPLGPSVVSADFNRDQHFDGALLVRDRNNFRIELHFRSHRVTAITFASNVSALSMVTLDINRDGNPDLIVLDPFSRQRLFVWLNDGQGSFHAVSADNYTLSGTHDCRAIPPSGSSSDYAALLGPSKMRCRKAASFAEQLLVATYLQRTGEVYEEFPASSDPVPNLVRGSPVTTAL